MTPIFDGAGKRHKIPFTNFIRNIIITVGVSVWSASPFFFSLSPLLSFFFSSLLFSPQFARVLAGPAPNNSQPVEGEAIVSPPSFAFSPSHQMRQGSLEKKRKEKKSKEKQRKKNPPMLFRDFTPCRAPSCLLHQYGTVIPLHAYSLNYLMLHDTANIMSQFTRYRLHGHTQLMHPSWAISSLSSRLVSNPPSLVCRFLNDILIIEPFNQNSPFSPASSRPKLHTPIPDKADVPARPLP